MVGPKLCSALKGILGKVACQGIGGPYRAALADNILPPYSTTVAAVNFAKQLLTRAVTKCPQTKIMFAGYR
jgi:cutinase